MSLATDGIDACEKHIPRSRCASSAILDSCSWQHPQHVSALLTAQGAHEQRSCCGEDDASRSLFQFDDRKMSATLVVNHDKRQPNA